MAMLTISPAIVLSSSRGYEPPPLLHLCHQVHSHQNLPTNLRFVYPGLPAKKSTQHARYLGAIFVVVTVVQAPCSSLCLRDPVSSLLRSAGSVGSVAAVLRGICARGRAVRIDIPSRRPRAGVSVASSQLSRGGVCRSGNRRPLPAVQVVMVIFTCFS